MLFKHKSLLAKISKLKSYTTHIFFLNIIKVGFRNCSWVKWLPSLISKLILLIKIKTVHVLTRDKI